MPNTPQVSVIMPFYNRADVIGETLDSILNQTFRDFELICVDDGSTDAVPQILKAYAQKDSRIKVIIKPLTNPGDTRNVGYAQSTGKYLFFLDSDDIFAPDYLAQMVNTLQKENADVVICKYDEFDHHTRKTIQVCEFNFGQTTWQHPVTTFLKTDFAPKFFQIPFNCVWNKIFKREIIEQSQLRFRDVTGADDIFFNFYYLTKCQRITVYDQVFIHHRVQQRHSVITDLEHAEVYCQEFDYLRSQLTDAEFAPLSTSYYLTYLIDSYYRVSQTTAHHAKKIMRHLHRILRTVTLHPQILPFAFYYACLKKRQFRTFYKLRHTNRYQFFN